MSANKPVTDCPDCAKGTRLNAATVPLRVAKTGVAIATVIITYCPMCLCVWAGDGNSCDQIIDVKWEHVGGLETETVQAIRERHGTA